MLHDCIFCQIVKDEAPAEFMYKNDSLVVFKDIHPHAPVHLLIVPRKHIRSINNIDVKEGGIVSEMILAGKLMAKRTGIAESGYKLLFNVERGGGQVIFHLHLHLLGGWK
jgi:histidine triad (HIT) family protein